MSVSKASWRSVVQFSFVCIMLVLASEAAVAQIVWSCKDEPKNPTFKWLAQKVAPVLWFSPDEPLIKNRNLADKDSIIPSPLPASEKPMQRTVYYRMTDLRRSRVSGRSSAQELIDRLEEIKEHAPIPFDNLSAVEIRYLFYYERDYGFGGHPHDLEAVDIKVEVRHTSDCNFLQITRIAGAAHGVDWYTNTLELKKDIEADELDMVLPPHILVEEGKHASAPDRNADGWYTPGYDSTRNRNDAWGVRDTLRNRMLAGECTMRKTRKTVLRAGKSWHLAGNQPMCRRNRPHRDLKTVQRNHRQLLQVSNQL